jgi:hypothetical protein
MTAAVALRNEIVFAEPAPPSRAESLAGYRRLREIGKRHHHGAIKFLSGDAIMQSARRLGLALGKHIVIDSEDELALVSDLAIHTAPPGRSRAIDRYANSARLASGSEEASVLAAMQNARFAVLASPRRHPSAGLILTDVIRETDVWLMDEGLEASLPEGIALATRYFTTEPFVMTAGVALPIFREAVSAAFASAPQLRRRSPVEAIQDRRFAEAVYRAAIENGTMENLHFREPGDEA